MMLKRKGQALAEYVVAGSLVAVVGIGGTLIFGNMFNGLLQELLHSDEFSMSASAGSGGGFGGAGGGGGSGSGGTLQNQALITSDGTPIYLENYPTDLANSLSTTGANGTTTQLLANMDNIVQGLQASGNLTSEQANLLMQLANQGHTIANVEAEIEAKIKAGESLNWKDYQSIGWGGDANGTMVDYENAQAMRDLYDKAVASGALSDPVAKQAVTILTNQILNIANGAENAMQAYDRGEITTEEEYRAKTIEHMKERDNALGINTQQSLTDLGAALVTHDSSGQICSAGSGSDSGTSCK